MFSFKQNYIKYNIKYIVLSFEMIGKKFIQHVVPLPQWNSWSWLLFNV